MRKTTWSMAPRSEPAGWVADAALRHGRRPCHAGPAHGGQHPGATGRQCGRDEGAPVEARRAGAPGRRVRRHTASIEGRGRCCATLPIRGPTGWCTTVPAGGGRSSAAQLLGVLVGRVEPEVERGRVEDHRHAVVDALHVRAAGRGDDGAAADVGRVRRRALVAPALGQAGEGQRRAVGPGEVVRLLGAGLRLVPLVEAVGGDDDAPLPEGLAEGGLGGHRLAARVEEPAARLRRPWTTTG